MKKTFGDKVADALRARAQDRDTLEKIVRALDSYPARVRDRHQVTHMQGRAELAYKDARVCTFYVRKGSIIVHPASADAEYLAGVDAAVDLMAILLADAIAARDNAAEDGWANGAAVALPGPSLHVSANGATMRATPGSRAVSFGRERPGDTDDHAP
jgi:hypothetical protein